MAMYLWIIFILTIFMALPDWWFYKKMKQHGYYLWIRRLSLVPLLLFVLVFLYIRYGLYYANNFLLTANLTWIFVVIAMIYVPKILYILFYYTNLFLCKILNIRTRFFRFIGFGVSICFIAVMFYSLIVTTSNFSVKQQVIEIKDLPSGFDGYRIALIADFHLGNWNNRYNIMETIVRLINEQEPDMVVFAGDMVNNYEAEFHGWQEYFLRIKSKNNLKFAVLGNHDYGDYTHWKTTDEKQRNLEKIKEHIRNLGFRLLLNENEDIISNGDTITVLGVENFGSGHFKDYSNLSKALLNTRSERLKILISHDPNHWAAEVAGVRSDIFLTLSGHTHAGQIGLIINDEIKISPVSLVYPYWDGLYKDGNQYLYVNRGIGFAGMPLRIGVPPEITVIELKKHVKIE